MSTIVAMEGRLASMARDPAYPLVAPSSKQRPRQRQRRQQSFQSQSAESKIAKRSRPIKEQRYPQGVHLRPGRGVQPESKTGHSHTKILTGFDQNQPQATSLHPPHAHAAQQVSPDREGGEYPWPSPCYAQSQLGPVNQYQQSSDQGWPSTSYPPSPPSPPSTYTVSLPLSTSPSTAYEAAPASFSDNHQIPSYTNGGLFVGEQAVNAVDLQQQQLFGFDWFLPAGLSVPDQFIPGNLTPLIPQTGTPIHLSQDQVQNYIFSGNTQPRHVGTYHEPSSPNQFFDQCGAQAPCAENFSPWTQPFLQPVTMPPSPPSSDDSIEVGETASPKGVLADRYQHLSAPKVEGSVDGSPNGFPDYASIDTRFFIGSNQPGSSVLGDNIFGFQGPPVDQNISLNSNEGSADEHHRVLMNYDHAVMEENQEVPNYLQITEDVSRRAGNQQDDPYRRYVNVVHQDASHQYAYALQGHSYGSDVETDVLVSREGDHSPISDQWAVIYQHNDGFGVRSRTPSPAALMLGNSSSMDGEGEFEEDYEGQRSVVVAGRAPEQKTKKTKRRFNEEERKETSDTRNRGSCLRCSQQKIRCEVNPDGDENGECLTCAKVRAELKKTVHPRVCTRLKVIGIVTFRSGGLGFTRRFTEEMFDLEIEFKNESPRIIFIQSTNYNTPLRLVVRRFTPIEGDQTDRRYMVNGQTRREEIATFCLNNMEQTARDFKHHVNLNAIQGLIDVDSPEILVTRTLEMIAQHQDDMAREKGAQDENVMLLRSVVSWWFASRHSSGSAFIAGEDTLDMRPSTDPDHPMGGKISIPRMVTAQFDVLQKRMVIGGEGGYGEQALRRLQQAFGGQRYPGWFTLYLACFLILHQFSMITRDRRRWALANCSSYELHTRYGPENHYLTKYVEDIHLGGWVLLVHWHYFKAGLNLLEVPWRYLRDNPGTMAKGKHKTLRFLSKEQLEFMEESTNYIKERLQSMPRTKDEGAWEHELFFISKMFPESCGQYEAFNGF